MANAPFFFASVSQTNIFREFSSIIDIHAARWADKGTQKGTKKRQPAKCLKKLQARGLSPNQLNEIGEKWDADTLGREIMHI